MLNFFLFLLITLLSNHLFRTYLSSAVICLQTLSSTIWYTNIIAAGKILSGIISTKQDGPPFITNVAWECVFC